MEAVILAGGESLRMKPHVWIPKPLVEINNGMTLLEWQVSWLHRHGFDHIIVMTRGFRIPELDVMWVESKPEWGTGGALKRALQLCEEEYVYALNCDDILLYNPKDIFRMARKVVTVVITRPRSPWGVVLLRGAQIAGFTEKPMLDFWVSAGHYLWHRESAIEALPFKGDLERYTLPMLAANGLAWAYKLEPGVKPVWLTVNNYKELLYVRKVLAELESF
ncbi:MAG: hypothetical protein DRJ67_06335 [Thermoprotei archaeon]|nr:MAG: hypothetical protein DRJ67_06335 [Thermoprotei archaeon]